MTIDFKTVQVRARDAAESWALSLPIWWVMRPR